MTAQVHPEPSPTGQQVMQVHPEPSPRGNSKERETKNMADKGIFGFMDPESIKQQVRGALEKQAPYDVAMYYKDPKDSFWPRIATNPVFENTTLGVISVNAVYIAIDTDWNKAEPLTPTGTFDLVDSGPFFQFMEHAFCVYFTFEWLARFLSFKNKANCRKDGWFVFDSALVFMMVMETWVMLIVIAAIGGGSPVQGTSILRLFRLLRLSRLMRMLRSLPELMILIKGMATAMKSVAWVMGLLTILTYVFAIAFTQLAVGTPVHEDAPFTLADAFPNIAHSMYTLLIYATLLDDLINFTDSLRFQSWPMLALSFVYIILAAWTVMNMLIGVLCEVVSKVADKERDDIRTFTLSEKMREVVGLLDKDEDKKISYKEFSEILEKPDALSALEDVGVSPLGLVDFAELFFFEDGQEVPLSFEDFMEMVLDLRESNNATVKDMLNVWMKIKGTTNKEVNKVKDAVEDLSKSFEEETTKLGRKIDGIESMLAEGMKDMMKLSQHVL